MATTVETPVNTAPVIEGNLVENDAPEVGEFVGVCEWFIPTKGYGFIKVLTGEHAGTNVFVHYSAVFPKQSNFKTLQAGEYVSLNVFHNEKGHQASNVRGIMGGALMCDHYRPPLRRQEYHNQQGHGQGQSQNDRETHPPAPPSEGQQFGGDF